MAPSHDHKPGPKCTDVKLRLGSNGTPTDHPPSFHPPNNVYTTQNWKALHELQPRLFLCNPTEFTENKNCLCKSRHPPLLQKSRLHSIKRICSTENLFEARKKKKKRVTKTGGGSGGGRTPERRTTNKVHGGNDRGRSQGGDRTVQGGSDGGRSQGGDRRDPEQEEPGETQVAAMMTAHGRADGGRRHGGGRADDSRGPTDSSGASGGGVPTSPGDTGKSTQHLHHTQGTQHREQKGRGGGVNGTVIGLGLARGIIYHHRLVDTRQPAAERHPPAERHPQRQMGKNGSVNNGKLFFRGRFPVALHN
ncbi:Type II inositol 1,4,5-trisphosphate 5-phosphatase [Labeo rohita]|uniref:Type II inositol 1,4,5-trisphosphate 5-phosphatase n=1 Tax=Labeo rohita TaxID=84645 RepID=A0ABQ8LFL3_LABRO|nr:Type II inositol 1,4,5-trisphosphate 5-phosphatase [Labeo rohita]